MMFVRDEGARTVMAKELAFEPLVRQALRAKYLIHAVVSTSPTPRGLKEIDAFHPYRVCYFSLFSFSFSLSSILSLFVEKIPYPFCTYINNPIR
jgi:hypothetical protein